MAHNQIVCSNGWCYGCNFDYANDDCEYQLVSIIIRLCYVMQNSYLKDERQVGIFIGGGMLIKIIELVSHYYYSGGYAY